MIYSIEGILSLKRSNFVVINVHGVEFKVALGISNISKLPEIGKKVRILTHMHVREDDLSLFGFLTADELELFELLISVSGVGPKSAIGIMSVAPAEQIASAISSGKIDLLQKSSGVGKKTAERIILDLKDKMSALGGDGIVEDMEKDDDVYEALIGLGYNSKQAKSAISKIKEDAKTTTERLKEALRIIKS